MSPMRTRPGPAGLAAVTGLLFVAVTVVVATGPRWLQVDVDGPVSDAVRRGLVDHAVVLDVLRVLTWLGHPLVVDAVFLVAALLLWQRGRRSAAVALVVTGVVSLLVRGLVKVSVDRPRPVAGFSTATGASFPSGHTAGAAFVAVAAVVVLHRVWVTAVAVAYAAVVGATRVLLDVHWLSDVIGGLLLGATFALLVPAVVVAIESRAGRGSPPA